MNKKNIIITVVSVAVLVLLIAGAALLYNKLSDGNEPDRLTNNESEGELDKEGTEAEDKSKYMAHDFTVYDADGNAVKLSDMRGKPVVLNFWASWCPPCKREMPDFNEKYLEYKDEIHFMMVNLTDGQQETQSSAEKFLATTDYVFPVYYDTDLSATYAYGIYSVPQTFFIDEEGVLVTMAQGAIDASVLQEGINYIYNKGE